MGLNTRQRNNEQIAKLLVSYAEKRDPLFDRFGGRAMNSFSSAFWAGFDGQETVVHNPNDLKYKSTLAYVCYRAGVKARVED